MSDPISVKIVTLQQCIRQCVDGGRCQAVPVIMIADVSSFRRLQLHGSIKVLLGTYLSECDVFSYILLQSLLKKVFLYLSETAGGHRIGQVKHRYQVSLFT